MPRIRRQTVFFPTPLPEPPRVHREIPVPAKYVRFFPGIFNTKRYGDGVLLPDLYLGIAEEPGMGIGVFTTRAAYPREYLMHYGVEISHARAKALSDKVKVPLFDLVCLNMIRCEASGNGFARHLESPCRCLLRLSPDVKAPEELVCQEKSCRRLLRIHRSSRFGATQPSSSLEGMCLWFARISFLLAVRFSCTTRSYASTSRPNKPPVHRFPPR
jgi:hypothetical protein